MELNLGAGGQGTPEPVGHILARLLDGARAAPSAATEPRTESCGTGASPETSEGTGRYDFDLAEFPLFSFCKTGLARKGRDPLVYTDTITGCDGRPIARTWKAYPGPFGFGGASTQALLYDLLQLYCEQGARGSQIQFGTVRSLLVRRGDRNPSKRDYARLRRDFDVLRGYDFHCTNAFWDRARRAYIDMNWRLFGAVFYFKPHPADGAGELPFGFIEVSSVLQQVARTRGFFSLGFGRELFYALKPLEQRLAVYLAKKFVSQKVHRRFVPDLARALPVEAACERDVRKAIRKASAGLLSRGYPLLAGFRFEKNGEGKWLATFDRKAAPNQDHAIVRRAGEELAPALLAQVERIVEAVGGDEDRAWWVQCVRRLGSGAVDRGLGLLKEARQSQRVRNPGGLLTKIFKDIASESGAALN